MRRTVGVVLTLTLVVPLVLLVGASPAAALGCAAGTSDSAPDGFIKLPTGEKIGKNIIFEANGDIVAADLGNPGGSVENVEFKLKWKNFSPFVALPITIEAPTVLPEPGASVKYRLKGEEQFSNLQEGSKFEVLVNPLRKAVVVVRVESTPGPPYPAAYIQLEGRFSGTASVVCDPLGLAINY